MIVLVVFSIPNWPFAFWMLVYLLIPSFGMKTICFQFYFSYFKCLYAYIIMASNTIFYSPSVSNNFLINQVPQCIIFHRRIAGSFQIVHSMMILFSVIVERLPVCHMFRFIVIYGVEYMYDELPSWVYSSNRTDSRLAPGQWETSLQKLRRLSLDRRNRRISSE